MVVIISLV